MKLISRITLAALLFAAGLSYETPALTAKRPRLVFAGTALRVGTPVNRDSGNVEVYQLVEYRVGEVCAGSYEGEKIVVDHLVLRPDDLKGLKVGDQVRVAASKSATIPLRYDDGEIRKTTDVVNVFYIGGNHLKPAANPCALKRDRR